MVEKGLVVVLTGNGKGKSSSAFGMILRSLGWGRRVLLVQFMKGDWETGEGNFFDSLKTDNLEIIRAQCPFTWKSQDKAKDAKVCEQVWLQAMRKVSEKTFDLIVLDELMIVLELGFLELEEIINFLKTRPLHTDVVMTGRNAPEELIAFADTVSEIKAIRHPFDKGIAAKKGIDF
ncbi:MAG: cob(I)yrinic acid a,c-diamide adenosyltransferase [Lentisphaerota bacterium]